MTTRTSKLLWDIGDAAGAIATFVGNRTFDDYDADNLLEAAVERKFDVIGEAARRLLREAPELLDRHKWLRDAVTFRNFLMHVYDMIDDCKVWRVIVENLPTLRADVASLLNEQST